MVHGMQGNLDVFEEDAVHLCPGQPVHGHPPGHRRRVVLDPDRVAVRVVEHGLDGVPVPCHFLALLVRELQDAVVQCLGRDARREHLPRDHLAEVVLVFQRHGELELSGHRGPGRDPLAPSLPNPVGHGPPVGAVVQRLGGEDLRDALRGAVVLALGRLRRDRLARAGLWRRERQASALQPQLHLALAGDVHSLHRREARLEAHPVQQICHLRLLLALHVGGLELLVLIAGAVCPRPAEGALVLPVGPLREPHAGAAPRGGRRRASLPLPGT
mmetsp:Transcript_58409/g.164961  ORF Transcript_58409/g.164961 Transcript_58409/m.164961 type:complete len:272 (-) Transcript_58409:4-819(-)